MRAVREWIYYLLKGLWMSGGGKKEEKKNSKSLVIDVQEDSGGSHIYILDRIVREADIDYANADARFVAACEFLGLGQDKTKTEVEMAIQFSINGDFYDVTIH